MGNVLKGTGAGLIEFFDYAEKKGLMKPATARSYKSAAAKVLAIDDENVDVRTLDVDDYFERFTHIHGHHYAPGSLGTYRARFKSGIDMYMDYLKDPQSFKAPTRQRRSRRSTEPSNESRTNTSRETREPDHGDQYVVEMNELLTYPFPLRSGQTAQLRLPHHLTSEDAERMAAFLNSLTIDPPLQLKSGNGDQ